MKQETILEGIRGVMGGTPWEIWTKVVIALFAMLWNNLAAIGMGAAAYFVLLLADALMGWRIAQTKDEPFSSTKFFIRPAIKFTVTGAMMFCLSVVDGLIPDWGWIPDTPLFYSGAVFMCVGQLRDVAQKYGTISQTPFANWLEEKLGTLKEKGEVNKAA